MKVNGYSISMVVEFLRETIRQTSEAAHRQRAIDASGYLSAVAPPTGSPDFALPTGVSNDPSARALAVQLEETCAAAWRFALAQLAIAAPGPAPTAWWPFALAGLTDSAVRAVHWRQLGAPTKATVAFPGL